MTKRALINPNEARGKDDRGHRVLEVVNTEADQFEVHSSLIWKDCPDDMTGMDKWWWDPITSSYKKMPDAVDAIATAGALATDDNGNFTEKHVWDWDTESYSKVTI